ncbi:MULTISPECIES: hypothetical protein [Cupriavidus]|uniref:Uncharacterized protein n=1 Tax=Cupriavidus pinatubonensis (strain JMP 134 / LMG 1197) TaxID=264198 RepID=Q46PR3_CUPPJ|nr:MULTISPECIES: hypothetical protein [Cupriavidus]QYY29724.1 hypothetical protein K2O51_06015 [Cupriavidus pinatubonensis]TPQ41482.1 hypothetical protein C2U69_07910 [Cupriavidus pinatubonensis]
MADTFLFSKPFTFLACPGMSEIRAGVEALEALPGHLFWLENEDFIRRIHVADFREQSRAALDAAMPGGVALIDALADEIRGNVNLLPALQDLDTEVAALAHSYCYWHYSADVLGRSQGIPRSSIERQFERAVAPRDGAHKLQWMCPCCDGRAHYQVDGLLATQRPARQGGFAIECPHCGHQERLYAGFLHAGRLECNCAVCKSVVQTLALQLARPARKLSENLEAYAWRHAAETAAEISELKEVATQRLARGDKPSENAMAFALAVLSNEHRPMPELLAQVDPTLEGRLAKNPRAWALLCELLQQGAIDCECQIYDQDGCQRAALEISVLDDDRAAGTAIAQDALACLLKGYQPSDRDSFVNWIKALKRLRLCTTRSSTAVDISWKPNLGHCRILSARQPSADDVPYVYASGSQLLVGQHALGRERPVYLDAELEALRLLKSLGYIVLSPEDIRWQHNRLEDLL